MADEWALDERMAMWPFRLITAGEHRPMTTAISA
jgi:hypothetical protein